ncbi:hypothetical protein RN001_000356 [Aquatica leii]|uniref:Uncharacterized protein n=1 Tax=Aquatica leii TaxID=1421715 RepID=A0AAN7SSF5_9COLE|nr:hypothetical protein RN001_000356 [Aquatica leii]
MAKSVQVKLPPDFDLQSSNAANEWKFWKTTFQDYLMASGNDEANDKVKLSILRNIIDHTNDYAYLISAIDDYVNPRVNECFERYTFLKRMQQNGETFKHFLTECKHLVKSCNYNTVDPRQTNKDKALRDKVVMGTREALLRIDELTLEKAITFH